MPAIRCDYNPIYQFVQTQAFLLGCTKHKFTFVLISQGTREIRLTGPAMPRDYFSILKLHLNLQGNILQAYISPGRTLSPNFTLNYREMFFVQGAGLSEIVRIVKI